MGNGRKNFVQYFLEGLEYGPWKVRPEASALFQTSP